MHSHPLHWMHFNHYHAYGNYYHHEQSDAHEFFKYCIIFKPFAQGEVIECIHFHTAWFVKIICIRCRDHLCVEVLLV